MINANIEPLFFQQGKIGSIIQIAFRLKWNIETGLLKNKFKDMAVATIIIKKELKIDKIL